MHESTRSPRAQATFGVISASSGVGVTRLLSSAHDFSGSLAAAPTHCFWAASAVPAKSASTMTARAMPHVFCWYVSCTLRLPRVQVTRPLISVEIVVRVSRHENLRTLDVQRPLTLDLVRHLWNASATLRASPQLTLVAFSEVK